jgi:hypothetical protein
MDNEKWAEKQVNDALRPRKRKSPADMYHVHLPDKVRLRFPLEHVGFMGSREVWRCSYCRECYLFNTEPVA